MSYQGHIKVKRDKKKYKKYSFMPYTFIYAWAEWYIYDCSWIIQGQALSQKVFQVVLG